MYIRKKHIGYAIVIAALLYPLIHTTIVGWGIAGDMIHSGDDVSYLLGVFFIAYIEAAFLGVGVILYILYISIIFLEKLFDNDDVIYVIKIPRFKRNTPQLDIRTQDLLRQLAHVDKHSAEYDRIWNELDKRGIWG